MLSLRSWPHPAWSIFVVSWRFKHFLYRGHLKSDASFSNFYKNLIVSMCRVTFFCKVNMITLMKVGKRAHLSVFFLHFFSVLVKVCRFSKIGFLWFKLNLFKVFLLKDNNNKYQEKSMVDFKSLHNFNRRMIKKVSNSIHTAFMYHVYNNQAFISQGKWRKYSIFVKEKKLLLN